MIFFVFPFYFYVFHVLYLCVLHEFISGGASPRPTFKLAKINLMTARTNNIQDANAFNVSGN